MLIWTIFAIMTGAAVLAVLWPLGRRQPAIFADTAGAKALYRAQLGEVDRDVRRGLIGAVEADAAKAEAGRRLLRVAEIAETPSVESEPALRRRRAASAITLSAIPLLALLIYGAHGAPNMPDQPLAARLQANPSAADFDVALARIEAHLAANPADGKGWAVLAPVYLRQGRHDDAARAFAAAIRHGDASPEHYAGLGEAQVLAAGGVVTVTARESLAEALKLEPANPRARFFMAIGREQDGDKPGAAAALKALLVDAPADAAWGAAVRARLEQLEGGSDPAQAIAALTPDERQAAIRGMVDGLAARLADGSGTLDDWSRLIRSQTVLGDREAALKSMTTARQRLASDTGALTALNELASELGFAEAAR